MHTSSSEDEISTDVFKEAIDQQFLNDNLYNTGKSSLISQSRELEFNKLDIESLRTSLKQENQFMNFGVTATFQSFVAKKLDEMLEKIIYLKQYKVTDHCMKQRRNAESGIKLLSSSKHFLCTTEVHIVHEKKSKKRKKYELVEDNEAMLRFQEAAVTPEHILSKLDTKTWTSKRPEPEFKYKKLKNGILIEQP